MPCIQRVDVNRYARCSPARGGYLDLWLDADAGVQAKKDDDGKEVIIKYGAIASAATGMTPTAIVLVALLLLALAVAVVIGAV